MSAIWLPSFLVALRDAASLTVGPCDDRTRTESKDDAPAAAADSQRETGREQRTVTDDCRKVGIFVNVNGPPVDGTGPEITFFFFYFVLNHEESGDKSGPFLILPKSRCARFGMFLLFALEI